MVSMNAKSGSRGERIRLPVTSIWVAITMKFGEIGVVFGAVDASATLINILGMSVVRLLGGRGRSGSENRGGEVLQVGEIDTSQY